MSPEAQRIAIAEACGWKWYRLCMDTGPRPPLRCLVHPDLSPMFVAQLKPAQQGDRNCGIRSLISYGQIPDYLADLNAINEAEQSLLNEQRREYARTLVRVHPLHYDPTAPGPMCHDGGAMNLFLIASMTAAQRAEAFLRTIGKWDDSK